jgi:hypothetical protein
VVVVEQAVQALVQGVGHHVLLFSLWVHKARRPVREARRSTV